MSETMKNTVLKAVAAIGRKSAELGCHSASMFGFHQPKEPASLQAEPKK